MKKVRLIAALLIFSMIAVPLMSFKAHAVIPRPEDLGTYRVYLHFGSRHSIGEADENNDPLALKETFDNMGTVVGVTPSYIVTFLDLNNDGIDDVSYSGPGEKGLDVDLLSTCKLSGKITLHVDKTTVMQLTDKGVKKYYSTIEFYFTERPDTLTGLTAKAAGKNKVELSWNQVSNVDGYLVYAIKNGKYGYVGQTQKTSFVDVKALDDAPNYYWVFPFVYNPHNNMITGGCAGPKAERGVLPAVTGLKALGSQEKVSLSWNKVPEADGYLIFGIFPGESYGYLGMTPNNVWSTTKEKAGVYHFWVFPFHWKEGTFHWEYGMPIPAGTPIPGRISERVYSIKN